MQPLRTLCLVALVGLLGSAAHAEGVADRTPLLNGTTRSKHVFSIPGVTANGTLGTVVMCTSLEKAKTLDVAVEVFSEDGASTANDVTIGQGVLTAVAPGRTVTFEIDTDVNGILATTFDYRIQPPGTIAHGSARVLSTSTKLMCAAGVLDRAAVSPASMMSLPVVAKTKQKGD